MKRNGILYKNSGIVALSQDKFVRIHSPFDMRRSQGSVYKRSPVQITVQATKLEDLSKPKANAIDE